MPLPGPLNLIGIDRFLKFNKINLMERAVKICMNVVLVVAAIFEARADNVIEALQAICARLRRHSTPSSKAARCNCRTSSRESSTGMVGAIDYGRA